MKLSKINIPEELIAMYPSSERDACKLLCIDVKTNSIEHFVFKDVVDLFSKNDLLVFNDTKVIKARLFAKKPSGGKAELLLLKEKNENVWECLVKGKNIKQGTKLFIDATNIEVEIVEVTGIKYEVRFPASMDVHDVLESSGNIPLPPYIKRQAQDLDNEMYQTVFAKNKGSVAAPTASLHFTEALIEKIRDKGVDIGFLTLHVGYGTFSPVKDPDTHIMHEEYFSINKELHDKICACKARSGKIWAVGTTVVRALESAFDEELKIKLYSGGTRLFIRPPYRFKVVDRLITNFHHPSTSLMYLVSAFAGEDIIHSAYKEAVSRHYKLLSYGDAMLIIR